MGSLSEQYNVCGTPGCRCKTSQRHRHGPYYQLSYTRNGKSTTRFVRREALAAVKNQLRNYARLRSLVNRWIDLAIQLSDLQIGATKRNQSARGG
jgi:macrodomain Ter protein organizer (MatP/YcbG family)